MNGKRSWRTLLAAGLVATGWVPVVEAQSFQPNVCGTDAAGNPVACPDTIAQFGGVNGFGFPRWVQDATGRILEVCLDTNTTNYDRSTDALGATPAGIIPELNPDGSCPAGPGGCLQCTTCLNADPAAGPLDIPFPGQPLSIPDNFTEEAFYFDIVATLPTKTGLANLIIALEAAFDGLGTVVDGEQIVFSRVRTRIDGALGGSPYIVTHPYGKIFVTPDGTGARSINLSRDIFLWKAGVLTLKGNFGVFPRALPEDPNTAIGDPNPARNATFTPWPPVTTPGAAFDVSGFITPDPFPYLGDFCLDNIITTDPAFVNKSDAELRADLASGALAPAVFRVEGPAIGDPAMVADFGCPDFLPPLDLDPANDLDCIQTNRFALIGKALGGGAGGAVGSEITRASFKKTAALNQINVWATSLPGQVLQISGDGIPPGTIMVEGQAASAMGTCDVSGSMCTAQIGQGCPVGETCVFPVLGTGRYFAHLDMALAVEPPASITVTNVTPGTIPVATSAPLKDDVTFVNNTYNMTGGANMLVVKAASSRTTPLKACLGGANAGLRCMSDADCPADALGNPGTCSGTATGTLTFGGGNVLDFGTAIETGQPGLAPGHVKVVQGGLDIPPATVSAASSEGGTFAMPVDVVAPAPAVLAAAGVDQVVARSATVVLDGSMSSGTLPLGTTYNWVEIDPTTTGVCDVATGLCQGGLSTGPCRIAWGNVECNAVQGGPSITTDPTNAALATFTFPANQSTVLTFALVVDNGLGSASVDTMTVTDALVAELAPAVVNANCTAPCTAVGGVATVDLNASGSTGVIDSVTWTQVGSPADPPATLTYPNAADPANPTPAEQLTPSFLFPLSGGAVSYQVTLSGPAGTVTSPPVTVAVAAGTPTAVVAPSNITVNANGGTVTLDGCGSIGTIEVYDWVQNTTEVGCSSIPVVLGIVDAADVIQPATGAECIRQFKAPISSQTLCFDLSVSNATGGASAPARVTVEVAPINSEALSVSRGQFGVQKGDWKIEGSSPDTADGVNVCAYAGPQADGRLIGCARSSGGQFKIQCQGSCPAGSTTLDLDLRSASGGFSTCGQPGCYDVK